VRGHTGEGAKIEKDSMGILVDPVEPMGHTVRTYGTIHQRSTGFE